MQKLFLLLLCLSLAVSANAQLKVYFVDDSGDAFGNSQYLASALDSLGYENIVIDAYGQGYTPLASEMSLYDLVIWHTSSWGLDLRLWDGNDSDNAELKQYLSQPNANLWLIGQDFFYDRYGAAPVTFQQGDFAYDHLGISQYAAQSYADDQSVGVPFVSPAAGQPIPGLADVDWQFSTLWYADGFALRPEATPVYLFGGNGYVLNGLPTGVWYHPAGGARVLTYGFDLSLASSFNVIRSNVGAVLDWWSNNLSATDSPANDLGAVSVSPNPFVDQLDLQVKTQDSAPVSARIFNAAGQLVETLSDAAFTGSGSSKILHWNAPAGMQEGFYYCTVQSGRDVKTIKLIKQKR